MKIVRTVYAEVPPRVEYRLSAQGKALRPVIDALRAWGVRRDAERFGNDMPVVDSEHASECATPNSPPVSAMVR